MLSNLAQGDVLFIDEIHRIARPAEELLYMAMEDFRVDVVVGKGLGATAIPLEISPVHPGRRHHPGRPAHRAAARPLRLRRPDGVLRASASCCRCCAARRAARRRATDDGSAEIAGRSRARRGSPTGCCAACATTPRSRPTAGDRAVAQAALALYDVDPLGLDRLDRAVLDGSVLTFGGGRSASTLAVAVGESRTPSRSLRALPWSGPGCWPAHPGGRVATEAAWHHLGQPPPRGGRRCWVGPWGGSAVVRVSLVPLGVLRCVVRLPAV